MKYPCNKGIGAFAICFLLFFVLHVSSVEVFSQKIEGLKIGEAAPDLKLTKLLKAPSNTTSLNELKGKVVVLEFWATWCAPCIPASEHLSGLAAKLKDKPIQFISITDEDETRVAQFLKEKKSFAGWIGLDEKRETYKAYKFSGIPHTVIIDAEGKIAAITFPKNITEVALSDALSGKKISLPVKESVADDLEWDKDLISDDTLFQFIIKPSYANTGGMYPKPGHITFDGVPIIVLFQEAFQMPGTRVVNNLPKSENTQKYRASIAVAKGRESSLYTAFQRILQETFDIRARREMREMDGFLLRVIDNKPILKPSESKAEYSFGRGKITGRNQSLSKLAEIIENFVGKPLIDETRLKEKYDWNLTYNYADEKILLESLRKELGLELVPAKTKVEMLIVERNPSNQ